MSEDAVFIVGAIIFAIAGVVFLYLSKAPGFYGTKNAVNMVILVSLYVANALAFRVLIRSDGNTVYTLSYVAYAFALYLLSTFLIFHSHDRPHSDYVWFPLANVVWVVLHFGSAVADSSGVRVWLFVLGAVVWVAVLYSMYRYVTWLNQRSHIDIAIIIVYGVITLAVHVGFILGQNGTGIIGTLGTAIWYLVTDFLLFVLFGGVSVGYLCDHHDQIKRSLNTRQCGPCDPTPPPCHPKPCCDSPYSSAVVYPSSIPQSYANIRV